MIARAFAHYFYILSIILAVVWSEHKIFLPQAIVFVCAMIAMIGLLLELWPTVK